MPPRPGGVAIATMVSLRGKHGTTRLASGPRRPRRSCVSLVGHAALLPQRDENGLRERVADAFGRHAGHFGDGQVHDAALVRIERPELLIDARSASPSRRGTSPSAAARRPCPCGSRARRRTRAARPASARPNAMSTTCCSALSGSPRWRTSSSASSPVRLRRGPSAVSSTSTVAVMPSAAVTRFRNSTIGAVRHSSWLVLARGRFGLARRRRASPAARRLTPWPAADVRFGGPIR